MFYSAFTPWKNSKMIIKGLEWHNFGEAFKTHIHIRVKCNIFLN
jgi:hypothetical protein